MQNRIECGSMDRNEGVQPQIACRAGDRFERDVKSRSDRESLDRIERAIEQQIEIELRQQIEAASCGRLARVDDPSSGALSAALQRSLQTPRGSRFETDARPPSVKLLHPELSYAIVGVLIEVHRWLGPGQLESTYQNAVEKELEARAIPFRAQVPITSLYKGWDVGEFVADVIVEETIVLELKAVSRVLPVHRAQLISYLRATGCGLGMLVNFHVPVMIHGIRRLVL